MGVSIIYQGERNHARTAQRIPIKDKIQGLAVQLHNV